MGAAQKPYVDTGPLLEKPIAEAAGLGWQGKSTILVEPKRGTWSFLGNIVTTLELPSGNPEKTVAAVVPVVLTCVPRAPLPRLINSMPPVVFLYLTIEHDGPIPVEFREAIGDRLYGCDECLDVCPWNKWAVPTDEANFAPRTLPLLREMLDWDEDTFTAKMQGSPMRRLKRNRFRRNICVVLGNVGTAEDLPALKRAEAGEDAVVAEHAHWAIRRIELKL